MQILALNAGSSTLKFALYGDGDAALAQASLDITPGVEPAVAQVATRLRELGHVPDAIAHRVVHGGDHYSDAVVFTEAVRRDIEALVPLAPQHNPLALAVLRAASAQWPAATHVAVFDTAFHASLSEVARRYAVPRAWHEAGLRRYGFHGLSHEHVAQVVSARVGSDACRIVSCHLGNGASVCAIAGGRSVDTSMGMTPLEGLVMGTRCGDLDPGAHGFLQRTLGLTVGQVEEQLNEASGLKGLSGRTGDFRTLERAAQEGDGAAALALQVHAWRLRKAIGAYAAVLGGLDAIAFTGGIGEHSPGVRRRALEGLEFLGARLDEAANAAPAFGPDGVADISADGPVRILVVRAAEEAMMVRDARVLLESGTRARER